MAVKSNNKLRANINKNFVIRVKNTDEKGSILIGAGQYHKIVGKKLALKHFNKVLRNGLDNYTFKIRNRLKIDFRGK